jgi:hypothetical protein
MEPFEPIGPVEPLGARGSMEPIGPIEPMGSMAPMAPTRAPCIHHEGQYDDMGH